MFLAKADNMPLHVCHPAGTGAVEVHYQGPLLTTATTKAT